MCVYPLANIYMYVYVNIYIFAHKKVLCVARKAEQIPRATIDNICACVFGSGPLQLAVKLLCEIARNGTTFEIWYLRILCAFMCTKC